jgi:hypothetical protein
VVLVGEWFRTLPATRMPRVQDYSELLMSWIGDQDRLFTPKSQDDHLAWMLRDYFLAIRTDLLERCKNKNLTNKDWTSPTAAETVGELLDAAASQAPGPAEHPRLGNVRQGGLHQLAHGSG